MDPLGGGFMFFLPTHELSPGIPGASHSPNMFQRLIINSKWLGGSECVSLSVDPLRVVLLKNMEHTVSYRLPVFVYSLESTNVEK